MPDARLRRTRATLPEGYQYGENMRPSVEPIPCGHRSQVAAQFTLVQMSDGTTERLRIPQKFRVRSGDRFCWRCGQWVDAMDDAEAEADNAWRAPHENAAEQLKRHADADAFKIGEPSNAGHLPQRFKAQRTGEEPV